ncbi:UvrD-helicase domain-containing protein, partial [Patescibacteria group bacterium]
MKLNQAQKQAINTIEGPVMVIAGPGTGKTQIIAERIARILKTTDTPPDGILALTFTESGAKAMRQRLLDTIGETAYYVNIFTFHSFCSSVIQEFPDRFVISSEIESLSQLERVEIFHQILDKHDFKIIKPINQPFYYTSSLIKSIQDLKREGISPQSFKTILKKEEKYLSKNQGDLTKTKLNQLKKDLSKQKELLKVYSYYQKILIDKGRYDFEDMINLVVEAFKKDKSILRTYQERLLYFLVDEYQDTNSAQNQVVDLLASYWGDQANIFTVGDPNQCLPAGTKIFTPQGQKNIETIKPRDQVLSAVGKGYTSYQKVKRVFKQTKKVKLITLTTKSGKKITTTDNHKMFCFVPPREMTNYWYVYLMYKKSLGWRMGITRSLTVRLKTEAGADKIIGISCHSSEEEARYHEMVFSLQYKIPTVIFQYRGNKVSGKWLTKLYQEFDTEKNAQKLADDLGINLNQPHYLRDATTLGDGRIKISLMMCSRNYRSKYDKKGLLQSPCVLHELRIQTSNQLVIKRLKKLGFKLRNKKIGKGFRLNSTDFTKLYKIAQKIKKDVGGLIDIKSSLGTTNIQHRPTRVMQAGNLLVGNYIPIVSGYKVIYDKIIKREEKVQTRTIYDLEVPPSHNFIANNIVVHNSIYRFQGASLENIISFTKTYPSAVIINLDQNYRSTQTILDLSHHLIQKNHQKIQDVVKTAKSKLVSQNSQSGKKLNLINLPSEILETYWIADQTKSLIKKGIQPEQIAVLFRHNADASSLASIFAKLNISVDIEGGANVLTDPTINQLLTLFKVINTTKDNLEDLSLFRLLHYQFFNFDSLDVLKLARSASKKKTSIINLIISDQLKDLDLKNPDSFINFLNQLTKWQQLDSQLTFSEFFEFIVKDSGFLDWIMSQPDAIEKLNRLNSLFSEVKRLNNADHQFNLNSFLNSLELMDINHLKITEKDLDIKSNAVTLTTAHKAKGKEWNHVFIYQAIDKKWGNNQVRELIKLPQGILKNFKPDTKEKNEDERRLFYVCLTRAKKQLYISYADRYNAYNTVREAFPSMFISEIPEKFIKKLSSKSLQAKAESVLKTLLAPPTKKLKPVINENNYLNDLLKDFKLSPTALNTYLTCPYKFKLNNLIRVPRAKESYLSFGTAVHKALEMFHRQFIQDDQYPSKQYLIKQFQYALKKEVLIDKDFKARLKQGKEILSAYFDYYQDDFTKPLFTEKFFGYGWSKTFLDDIPLAGKVDRIDWHDQSDKTATVIDYKTGSPKTRNQILGKTKDSNADYYRQLVFYKLLAKLDQTFKPEVVSAELDFVQPNNQQKFKKETFKISDQDLKDLRQTIKKAMKQIRSLNFQKTKDYSQCSRCEYKSHCWPDG